MAAATRAAEAGQQVGLVDDNPRIGGQIWRSPRGSSSLDTSHGEEASKWRQRLMQTSVEQLQGWSIFAQPAPGQLLAESQECDSFAEALELSFDRLILATGARERFLPFPGWTLPNVMGVGGLQAMLKGGLPIAGKRIVIAGSGPLLLAVAATLKKAGGEVLHICEQAPLRQIAPFALSLLADPGKLAQGIGYRLATLGVPFSINCWPVEALGDTAIRSVVLSNNGRRQEIACDYIACGFHLVPNTELASLLGCRIENDAVVVDDFQRTTVRDIFCAGEPTGIGGLEISLLEGEISGLTAAGKISDAESLLKRRRSMQRFSDRLFRAFRLRDELRKLSQPGTLVCRCEDVPFSALQHQPSWRAAKLHTRCGMGPCQGRVCGAAASFLFGFEEHSVRPPVLPARIASLGSAAVLPLLEITDKQEIP